MQQRRRFLSPVDPAIQFEVVPETGSTNADLRARLSGENVPDEGHWLIADRQNSGRGRQGRSWLDGPGNFMGSTIVCLGEADPPASTLSFVAALAVYGATCVRLARPSMLQLKWPNDVLLSGAKFCGILLEREGRHAVVGIGVNLAGAPKLPDRKTLSLADTGSAPDRDLFARDLAASFSSEVAKWREHGAGPMLCRWQAAAHRQGTRLSVHDDEKAYICGAFDGLEEDGGLRLRLDDGSVRVIHAGDVMLEND